MPEHTKAEAGVIEAYPGIIESTDIDPLHHERNKGVHIHSLSSRKVHNVSLCTSDNKTSQGYIAAATDMAASAAKYVYSSAVGDEAGKKTGTEGLPSSSK